MARPSSGPAPTGPPQAGIVDRTISEWELSDEYAGKFWEGVNTAWQTFLAMLLDFFWANSEETTEEREKRERRHETGIRRASLNREDCANLGRFTKEAITTGMKKLGVKTLDRAEQLIDGFGAVVILIVFLGNSILLLAAEIPKSPRWVAFKAKMNSGQPEGAAPRPRGWRGLLSLPGGRGGPAWGAGPPEKKEDTSGASPG